MTHFLKITILFLCIISVKGIAQLSKTEALYKSILLQDSLLFSVGFNHCNIQQYDKSLSENLRFYHDKDGISDKAKFLNDLKNGLCKNPEKRQVKRILVKGSSQVFPLYKNNILYGAVHNGEHQFYENRETEAGIAKFSNLWILENKEWKLQTSSSFDHKTLSENIIENKTFDNDTLINSWLKDYKIPILGLGIIEEGKLSQIKVYGDLKKDVKAPYNTIFNP